MELKKNMPQSFFNLKLSYLRLKYSGPSEISACYSRDYRDPEKTFLGMGLGRRVMGKERKQINSEDKM